MLISEGTMILALCNLHYLKLMNILTICENYLNLLMLINFYVGN
jgi:hypothetical protein